MNKLSVKKKADPEFFANVGKYIQEWLNDNKQKNQKPRDQEELGSLVGLTASQVSKIIHGVQVVPEGFREKICKQLNFNETYFENYLASKTNNLHLEQLTKEDVIKLVIKQQDFINTLERWDTKRGDRLIKMIEENAQLLRSQNRLLDEKEKYLNEIRELKRNLRKYTKIEE